MCYNEKKGGLFMQNLEHDLRNYFKQQGIHKSDSQIKQLSKRLEKRMDTSAKKIVKQYEKQMGINQKKWYEIWK